MAKRAWSSVGNQNGAYEEGCYKQVRVAATSTNACMSYGQFTEVVGKCHEMTDALVRGFTLDKFRHVELECNYGVGHPQAFYMITERIDGQLRTKHELNTNSTELSQYFHLWIYVIGDEERIKRLAEPFIEHVRRILPPNTRYIVSL